MKNSPVFTRNDGKLVQKLFHVSVNLYVTRMPFSRGCYLRNTQITKHLQETENLHNFI